MANKKDRDLKDVLGNVGFVLEVFKVLVHAVLALGGTIEHMRRLIKEPELARSIARLIVPEIALSLPVGGGPYRGGPAGAPVFRAFVQYVQPAYAILKQAFDWVYDGYKNAEFTAIEACKNVLREACEIEFELVHFGKDMSTDVILAELDKRGLRPALYEELLAFAAKYPELQKQFPIVALGSVCRNDGDLFSPYVSWGGDERSLNFAWFDYGWGGVCRFLAVRKP